MAIAVLGAFIVFPKLIVSVLLGKAYPVESYVFLYGITALCLGFSLILMFYGIANKKWRISIPLISGLIAEILLLAIFHQNILEIILGVLGGAILTLLGLFLVLRKEIITAVKQKKGYFQYSDVVHWPYRI